jgi:hypothetical protein
LASVLTAAAVTIVYVIGPSTSASSAPVTVTVCGVCQFAFVKIRLAGRTVPSVVSLELRAIVTLAVGCVVSTTVNVAVPPASVVASGPGGLTLIPAPSLSLLVTRTSGAFRVL